MTPGFPAGAALSPALRAALVAIGLGAVAGPSWLALHPPRFPVRPHARGVVRVVPQAEVPQVEPVAFEDLSPDDARDYNATVPFVSGPNPAARPFRFAGTSDERARAIDCLATAALYEAGDDSTGERAVAQVVLNRLRHPAFPKTVCGVVFQGAERSTGCQFTFTCDGALVNHRWSDAAWTRARQVAGLALSGGVYKAVGYATHYHTDWVVPYWQSSLDKIAAVHTHLFFRWTGWWGTPPAFNRHPSEDEPVIAALAAYSDAHRAGGAQAEADAALAEAAAITSAAGTPAALGGDPDTFVLKLDPHMMAEDFPIIAAKTCGDRTYCKVMGWADATQLPKQLPVQPAQIATMTFSYLRDTAHGFDKALWNCKEFERPNPSQCMKVQLLTAPVALPGVEAGAPVSRVAVPAVAVSKNARIVPPPEVPTKLTPPRATPTPLATPTPAVR